MDQQAAVARQVSYIKQKARAVRLSMDEMLGVAADIIYRKMVKLNRKPHRDVTKEDDNRMLEYSKELCAIVKRQEEYLAAVATVERAKNKGRKETQPAEQEEDDAPQVKPFVPGRIIQPANGSVPTDPV
jgi:hypothetical protein